MANKNSFNSFSQLAAAANLSTESTDTETPNKSTEPEVDTTGAEEQTTETTPVEETVEPVLTLNDRDVQTWTTEELEAYITKQVDCDVFYSTVVKAIAELRIRDTRIAAAWTVKEATQFLLDGTIPVQTSKGAWVNDVTRVDRKAHQWTTQELESWALGEIKAEGNTRDAHLALELQKRLKLVVKTHDVDAIIQCYKAKEGLVTKTTTELPTPTVAVVETVTEVTAKNYTGLSTMNQSYLEHAFSQFKAVMQPGKAVSAFGTNGKPGGADAQKLLKEAMSYAIGLAEPTASAAAMQYILDYFAANRAHGQLFEDTYAFRFIDEMKCTIKEKESHAALLTLFLAYADPMTELRAQTDVVSLIKGVPTRLQSRLIEFFKRQG